MFFVVVGNLGWTTTWKSRVLGAADMGSEPCAGLYNQQSLVYIDAEQRACSCQIHLPFLIDFCVHNPCMFLAPAYTDCKKSNKTHFFLFKACIYNHHMM